jgi:predicted nuclease of restriction endonuclease-like (RecB) superfamily
MKSKGAMAMENKLEKIGQNSFMDNFVKTDDILKDMCGIIESSQKAAYQAVNTLLVQRNWLIGYRIAEEELGGDERSEYGLEVIKKISKELTQRYGKGYDRSNLYHCLKFYKTFPEIVDTACRQSGVLLSWSHYRTLLQVKDPEARDWYEKEAAEQTWSVRTLQRNISSQYYYRMLGTQKKELVESEMKELTAPYQNDKLEFIKNPVVAEFLGFSQNTDFTESDLEKSILSNLQKFLMELGKGYAFVARQQHIHTEKQDYYIDLVFYNYILKCFVLIDLKTEKITHQDKELAIMFDDPFERAEEERLELEREELRQCEIRKARIALSMLQPLQRERLMKNVCCGLSSRAIAKQEGVYYSSVDKSIAAAKKNFIKFYENL